MSLPCRPPGGNAPAPPEREPQAAQHQLTIAEYPHLTATKAQVRTVSWGRLAELLGTFTERGSKDGRLWSPITFKPKTEKKRADANIASVNAFVFDYDHQEPPWALLDGLDWIAHTTFTHHANDSKCERPDCPHWRVVVRLATPIPAAEYPEAWARLVFAYAPDADPSCKDASRASYYPACRPGAPQETRLGVGPAVDWQQLPPVPVAKQLADAPRPASTIVKRGAPRDGERPGDRFNRTATWDEILEPTGARCVATLGDGSQRWRRPGKQEGQSATAGGGGSDVLYMFTSNWAPFEPNTSYTKFRAYTLLEHGGDERAAVRALAEHYGMTTPDDGIAWAEFTGETWMPKPEPASCAPPPPASAPDGAGRIVRDLLEFLMGGGSLSEPERTALLAALGSTSEPAGGAETCEGNCSTVVALRREVKEYKAADQLVRFGPFSPISAQIHKHLIVQADVARRNGQSKVALFREEVARVALNDKKNVKAVTRAWAEYETLQKDPEVKARLHYLLERRVDERGKEHVDLVVPVSETPPTRTDMYILARQLPRLKPAHGGERQPTKLPPANPPCRKCGETMATHRTRQDVCLNDTCDNVVSYPTKITRPPYAGPIVIHGAVFSVAATPSQGDEGQDVPRKNDTYKGQDVPRLPVTSGTPVSMVSRADMEAAAGPHYQGDAPPEPPPPPPMWTPPPLAPRSHIARGFRSLPPPPKAVSGGSE